MVIRKKLNNNVAIALDEYGSETVVMGNGLTFDKKAGDQIEESKIEKKFVLSNNDAALRLQEIMIQIPSKYLEVSNIIIEQAKDVLDTNISDSIYVSLTDHVHMAVKRFLDGMTIPNPMLWDIKRFYPKEYMAGKNALAIIKSELKVELPEDEAGFIAFHFVNAEEGKESSLLPDIMKLVKEITNIVKYQLSLDLDEESVYYYRFITHLKFFAQRMFSDTIQIAGGRKELLAVAKENYKEAYQCVQSIKKFVENKYKYIISDEEQFYLAIHIENIMRKHVGL